MVVRLVQRSRALLMDHAADTQLRPARPWMPRLLRPEVAAAMLARQCAGQSSGLALDGDAHADRDSESCIGAAPACTGTKAGDSATIVGGSHSLAEQWILFQMEVELEAGADGAQRAPATLTVREGDVPAEIAAVCNIRSLELRRRRSNALPLYPKPVLEMSCMFVANRLLW